MSFKAPTLVYSNNCFKCNLDFSFWKGKFRYHCRGCGNNFCNDCLQNYCALPGILKQVRTCDTCYQKYKDQEKQNGDDASDEFCFESALNPGFRLEHENVDDSFENINLDEEYEEMEEENAQYLPVEEDVTSKTPPNVLGTIDNEIKSNIFTLNNKSKRDELVDDRQLKIALSLSRIENKFLEYTTSSDTALMSEEEQVDYVLRLSALEEKAKTIVSRLEMPKVSSKSSDEDEDLALALAISKIESDDVRSSEDGSKSKENAAKKQVHCPICFEERLEYALVACGHVVCGDCKPKLEECPLCRADIRGAIRVFITD